MSSERETEPSLEAMAAAMNMFRSIMPHAGLSGLDASAPMDLEVMRERMQALLSAGAKGPPKTSLLRF